MRTTWTGLSILVRGLWKFAMTWVRDVHEMGFHVVEDDKDEWVIAPLSAVELRRLRRNQDDVISESHHLWWVVDWGRRSLPKRRARPHAHEPPWSSWVGKHDSDDIATVF